MAKKKVKRSVKSAKGKVRSVKPAARKTSAKSAKSARRASAPASATGLSLHIGLSAVNPTDYSGWSGPLAACEFDALDMERLAAGQKLKPTVLLTRDATRNKTLALIRKAAAKLKSGDLFVLSYSGHGGQVDDVSSDEADKLDETWCLFDGQLIDDELFLELSKFAKGVRIFVLSDSCHSGTVTRARPTAGAPAGPAARIMPPDIAQQVYQDHKAFYDGLQRRIAKAVDPDAALAQVSVTGRVDKISGKCQASVILISGCLDHQTSLDGSKNGAFTEQLLKVWNGGFKGDYKKFHETIVSGMPSSQTPNLYTLGSAGRFARQQPFRL